MKQWWLALLWAVMTMPAWAANFEAERRMLDLAAELRCLVCQNESIAASRADLAVDLRQQIREQIQAGKSNAEIRAYMVERYGDFVLYRPPLRASTLLLWFGPTLFLFFGVIILSVTLRRHKSRVVSSSLNHEERIQAEALLRQSPDTGEQP